MNTADTIKSVSLSLSPDDSLIFLTMKQKYEEQARTQGLPFKQIQREHYLIGMMKINFLKRLESSIESFEISMDRTIQKIEKIENRINEFLKLQNMGQEEGFWRALRDV